MLPPIYQLFKSSTAVKNIIGNNPRVYRHGSAPQDTTKPYVTWQLISGVPENSLSETPKIDRQSIQVNCWHQTDSGVEELAIAVRNSLETVCHITATPINEREIETKLYRISLQADYWLDR